MEVNRTNYNIVYDRPLLSRRIYAAILDFIIFVILFLCLFFCSNAIVKNTNSYKTQNLIIEDVHINSYLYVPSDGPGGSSTSYTLISDYFDTNKDEYTAYDILIRLSDAIENDTENSGFIYYLKLKENDTKANEASIKLKQEYDNFKINMEIDGTKVYIDDDGNILSLPKADYKTVNEFFITFINDTARGYLTYVNGYNDALLYITRTIVLIQIPIPLTISCLIVYLLIPLIFFKRNKQTLGKLAFKIGLVNKDLLAVSNLKYLYRFLIFFFIEIILSIFLVMIPLIISFSMIFFTKNKQCLHDYILKIQEVDLYNNKIYYSLDEVILQDVNSQHIDFKLK